MILFRQLCTTINNISLSTINKTTKEFPFTNPTSINLILKSYQHLPLTHTQFLHAYLTKLGFLISSTSIANSLINSYAKLGHLHLAHKVFDRLVHKDSVSWNVLINSYFRVGEFYEGLSLFRQARITLSGNVCDYMPSACFEPNTATLVLLFQACHKLGDTIEGLRLHCYMIQSGYMAVVSVRNSVLNFYADVDMKEAQKLFDETRERDLISWSVMIGGYAQSEDPGLALHLFREILSCNEIEIDAQLTLSVIKVSVCLEELGMGKMIHGFVVSRGFHNDLFVGNTLIDMYSKCYDTEAALGVFTDVSGKNIVSYNSLLSGFVDKGKFSEALDLFSSMQKAKIKADEVTMVNLLQTTKHFLHSVGCKSIHSLMFRLGHEKNKFILNSLIDAYAKCNMIALAWKIFNRIEERDVVTWSTMIGGFTNCGMPSEAIFLFQKLNTYEKPNTVTILNLLEACSVLAEVKMSKSAHAIAIRNGLADDVVVGTATLDMYSKCGAINMCERVFEHQIPRKNILTWSSMISAYGFNGLSCEALKLVAKMKSQGIEPNSVTVLSVLSSCSHGGLIEEGISYFNVFVRDNEGVKLGLEHYSCVVDLLARGGKLNTAMELIKQMSNHGLDPGASAWGALLSACRRHRENGENFKMAENAVARILELEPCNSGGYMLALGMYASGGSWVEAARIRGLVRERGVRVVVGYSLVHVNGGAFKFVAGDKQVHRSSGEVSVVSKQLHLSLKMDRPQEQAFLEGL